MCWVSSEGGKKTNAEAVWGEVIGGSSCWALGAKLKRDGILAEYGRVRGENGGQGMYTHSTVIPSRHPSWSLQGMRLCKVEAGSALWFALLRNIWV